MPDFRALWDVALPYGQFLAESEHHRGLWQGIYNIMRVPDWAFQAVPPGTRRRLLTYLRRSDLASYRALIEQLGLRH